MKETMKRLLTLTVAMAMLFSMLSVGVSAQAVEAEPIQQAETEPTIAQPVETECVEIEPVEPEYMETQSAAEPIEATALELDVWADAVITSDAKEFCFAFTPAQSGTYIFESASTEDTVAELRNANGWQLTGDDDSGEENNFMLSYALTAGETYYLNVFFWNNNKTGKFPVRVFANPVVKLELAPISAMEGTCGHMRNEYDEQTDEYDLQYWYYEPWNLLERSAYTVTFRDGSIQTGSGEGFEYQGMWYSFNAWCDQNYENQWVGGNTYIMTVSAMGVETEVPVTITKAPLVSLEFTPISVMEGTCGGIASEYNEQTGEYDLEYWRYEPWDLLRKSTYTATFRDGTVLTGSEEGFEYQGIWYNFTYKNDQSYENQWQGGNTYAVTISLMGVTTEMPVTIEKSPLVSLEFTPVSIMAGTGGHMRNEYDGQYWYYEPWNILRRSTYTATFRDGTVLTGSGEGFEYQGRWYNFNCQDQQSYDNQWTVGNTYAVTVSLMGITAEVPVTIEGSPLISLEFTPISIVEGACGHTEGTYNEHDEYVEYWYYEPWALMSYSTYKATFKDGTVLTGNGDGFDYQGEWYSFNCFTDQDYDNQWTVGNTYVLTVSLMGVTVDVPVTIEKTPLVSLEFAPISVMENSYGYTREEYNEQTGEYVEYWYYEPWNLLRKSAFTATFSDGTVLSGNDNGFNYQGTWYSFNGWSDQGYENQWTVGNTYVLTVSLMGVTVEVPVTIEKTPLVSLKFTPVSTVEGADGHMREEYNGQYWYYDPWSLLHKSTYTATFSDGTVLTGSGEGFEYQGTWYSFDNWTDQDYENQWTVGNTYAITVSVMGVAAEVPVTIEKSPLVSLKFTPVSVLEGTSGYLENYYNENGAYVEYWYYQPWNLLHKSTYTATFSDGTVLTGNGEGFNYQGTWYHFDNRTDQSGENPWTVGNTYAVTVSLMGITVEVPVTIEKSPIIGLTVSPIVFEEHTGGYWSGYYEDGQYTEYYYYRWREQVSYTVTMSDGTEIVGNANGFEYNGTYYYVDCFADQGNGNTWLVGNTYPITVSVMGQMAESTVTISAPKTADGFNYIIQGDKAVITNCALKDSVLKIPQTIEGYDVVGITSLGNALRYATEIHIPDSVTMLSGGVFENDEWYMWDLPLEKLYIGSGVATLSVEMLRAASNLKEVVVAAENPYYCSVDGVVYNKDCSAMIFYPFAKQDTHVIPDSVTDIGIIFENNDIYAGIKVQFGAGITDYQIVDGVIYNSDQTVIFGHTSELTGSYVMPDSVMEIAWFAFANSDLTEVTLSSNVTGIVYGAFSGSTKLESIHIPESVSYIEPDAFANCNALEAVCIDDLAAWCRISFSDNPLAIARDLYLNGELVTDLVLPSVTTMVYGGAFINGSMTSVTIPSNVKSIGYNAFYGSEIETVNFSEGLESIEYYAFANTGVKCVNLPDSLVWMGESAFSGCRQLEKLTIGEGLTELSWSVFANTGLTSVVIPKNVRYIQANAFRNSKLTDVQFDCDEVYIGGSAFQNCPLGDLVFGDNVKMIDEWAFTGSLATQVILPESVTEITYRAFAFSYDLVSVTIPDSVTSIHPGAFEGDSNLAHVLYTGTQEQWYKIGCESAELNQAIIHYNAVGDEVTTERTEEGIRYYCAICDGAISDVLPGDFTADGDLNNDDVVALLWHVLFPEEYPVEMNPDLTKDGSVNNDDVVALLWYVLFPEEYPL